MQEQQGGGEQLSSQQEQQSDDQTPIPDESLGKTITWKEGENRKKRSIRWCASHNCLSEGGGGG